MPRPLPPPQIPVIDPRTGLMTRDWYDYLRDRDRLNFADLRDVDMTTTAPTNGQHPVWNATSKKWLPGA
jgi:hypothetical protein